MSQQLDGHLVTVYAIRGAFLLPPPTNTVESVEFSHISFTSTKLHGRGPPPQPVKNLVKLVEVPGGVGGARSLRMFST